VLKDAQVTSIKEWRLRTEAGRRRLTQRVVHAVVVDKRDRTFALTGEVQRVATSEGPGARWSTRG